MLDNLYSQYHLKINYLDRFKYDFLTVIIILLMNFVYVFMIKSYYCLLNRYHIMNYLSVLLLFKIYLKIDIIIRIKLESNISKNSQNINFN